jgi:hypothetical protein
MEVARFSFSNPVSSSMRSSDKKNCKANDSGWKQDEQHDSLGKNKP